MSTGSGQKPAAAFPRAVLCVGPDRWLRARAVERTRARCISPGFEETDFVRFSEPPAETERILEVLQTAPFGSACRVVVVDGLDEIGPESVPWLPAYLERAEAAGCAVLCGESVASGFPAVRPAAGRLERISCQPLKGTELEAWIQARAQESGKKLERAALLRLIERLGGNLQALDRALENLILMVGAAAISEPDVRRIVPPSIRESAFGILDCAAAGRPAEAIRALRESVEQGELTMDQFFGALGWYYRNAWKTRRRTKKEIGEALEDLLKSDVRLKQGHPDPELLADRLLLKLSGQPGLLS
ncbi:MAG: DNA polymerase III subunit delta [Candidatus Omnitrophica bacterium]|nr:DNA polymerase III subunit delta [Candidatus Omnitrophota bacterium]